MADVEMPEVDHPPKANKRQASAIPTRDELNHLRDTEDLFSTNLLKLEVDELLGEVKVDYAKQKRIESALLRQYKGL